MLCTMRQLGHRAFLHQCGAPLSLLRKNVSHIGESYEQKGAYHTALDHYTQANLLVSSSNTNDLVILESIYRHIGNIQFKLNQFEESLKWYKKQLLIAQKQALNKNIIPTLDNISSAYFKLNESSRK